MRNQLKLYAISCESSTDTLFIIKLDGNEVVSLTISGSN